MTRRDWIKLREENARRAEAAQDFGGKNCDLGTRVKGRKRSADGKIFRRSFRVAGGGRVSPR